MFAITWARYRLFDIGQSTRATRRENEIRRHCSALLPLQLDQPQDDVGTPPRPAQQKVRAGVPLCLGPAFRGARPPQQKAVGGFPL